MLKRINTVAIRLMLFLCTLVVGMVAFDVWYDSKPVRIEDTEDYLPQVHQLRAQNRIGEALAICAAANDCPVLRNRDELIRIGEEIKSEQASWWYKTKQFTSGFVIGDVESGPAMFGTILSDFCFIGDLRDAGKEGYHWVTGADVDYVILVLSSSGIVTTIAAYSPATEVAVPAKVGISVVKALLRIGAMSKRFIAILKDATRAAKEAGNVMKLVHFLQPLRELQRLAPAGSFVRMVKHIDTVEDAEHIVRLCRVAPNETAAILAVRGKIAIAEMKHVETQGMLVKMFATPRSTFGMMRWITIPIKVGYTKIPAILKWSIDYIKYKASNSETIRILLLMLSLSALIIVSLSLFFGGQRLFRILWQRQPKPLESV